ncbi:MAG: serine hydrolase domain-containing protein [bacterium]
MLFTPARRLHSLVFVVVTMLWATGLYAQEPAAATTSRAVVSARLDSLARKFLSDGPAVGATVAVVKGSDTLLLIGVGERDRSRHLAAEKSTIYRIGSITKQFTAAAILQLIDAGKLSLTDSLGKVLPQYPQWRAVTVRQLLNHSSGIASYTASSRWSRHWKEDLTPAALVAFVAKDTLDFTPGTQWHYTNTGYVLLGMILERISGVSYAEYVRSNFFVPLGMRSATYCPSRPTSATFAAGYESTAGKMRPTAYISMTQPWAAGGLCMSVPDYLRWNSALTSGVVLPAATYARMAVSDTLSTGAPTRYGFGLIPLRLGTHAVVHHGGDVHGFSAEELWLPDDSLRVVVFTNTLGSNPKFLADNLASAVLGLPLHTKILTPLVQLAVNDRAKYLGTYDIVMPSGRVLPLRVFSDADGLAAKGEAPGQGTIRLTYLGGDTFGAEFDSAFRFTVFFENGKAVKARLIKDGATMEGVRRPLSS